ncbi:MAG: type IV secretion system protein [Pseudomonadota bacterium]
MVTIRPNAKPIASAPNSLSAVSYTNPVTGAVETANCSENQTSYSPICGRYGLPSNMYYVDRCWKNYGDCPSWAGDNVSSWTYGSWSSAPIIFPYKDDASLNYSWSQDLNTLAMANQQLTTSSYISNSMPTVSAQSICDGGWASDGGPRKSEWTDYTYCAFGDNKHPYDYTYAAPATPTTIPSDIKFWYSADTATALLYRFDTTEIPTDKNSRGTSAPTTADASTSGLTDTGAGYRFAKIIAQNKILQYTHLDSAVKYLQFRPISNTCTSNTGGYILGIKQTKCHRNDGLIGSDANYAKRGQIQYLLLPTGQDPNITASLASSPSSLPEANNGDVTFTAASQGILWMRINNKPSDVVDSTGQYKITQSIAATSDPSFSAKILNPLLAQLKEMVTAGGKKMFKNMICYQSSDKAPCTNFFNYIKSMLTLYIVIFGLMFLLGMKEITQKDLVTRVIKIAIVSGLISGQTFELFNTYIFEVVINFSDQIISNIAGYRLFTSGGVSNPMMFMEELLSKIFFSKVFISQILATMSFGIFGPFYFLLILISIVICVISLLRALAIYIMAFVAVALLLGLAPFFLTFMLFDRTYYLFENWSRFLFRYMIEPAVLMAGITILTKLFAIYLDNVLNYSTCWKCAIEFMLPFPSIPGLPTGFLGMPLFCINWFGPWGLDSSMGTIGMNMQNIVALMIIAYVMYGYAEFSGQIVTTLTGTPADVGATSMGMKMSSAMGQAALGKVGLDARNRDRKMKTAEGKFDEAISNMGEKGEKGEKNDAV